MKHFKIFDTINNYNIWKNSNNYVEPNVIKTDSGVIYNKLNNKYIEDGLIFLFDGTIPECKENILTDFISKKSITTPGTIDYVTNDNNLQINNLSSYARITFDNDFTSSENYTVEVCFEKTNSNSKILLFACGGASNHKSPMFVEADNYLCFIQNYNKYNYKININEPYTISLNKDNGYVNKNHIEITSTPSNWAAVNNNMMGLFRAHAGTLSYPETSFKGKLYSIRIYDRVLTQEEQLHNQNLDIRKFKLNI